MLAIILPSLWIVAHFVVVVRFVASVVTLQWSVARTEFGRWMDAVLTMASVGYVAFGWGLAIGFEKDVGDSCRGLGRPGAGEVLTTEDRTFPPSTKCVWADGSSVELVPFWLNPLIYLCMAGVAVSVVFAIRAAGRRAFPTTGVEGHGR